MTDSGQVWSNTVTSQSGTLTHADMVRLFEQMYDHSVPLFDGWKPEMVAELRRRHRRRSHYYHKRAYGLAHKKQHRRTQ